MSKKKDKTFDMFLVSKFGIVPCRIPEDVLVKEVEMCDPISLEYAFDIFKKAIDSKSE